MGDLMDMPIILDNTGDILTLRLTPEDQARAQNGQQRAQWFFVKMLYNVDGSGGKPRSTKLTDKHIDPQGYVKMKVKYASQDSQVFSHQVSTALGVYMNTLQQLEQDHGFKIPNGNENPLKMVSSPQI